MHEPVPIDTAQLGPIRFAVQTATYAILRAPFDAGWTFEIETDTVEHDGRRCALSFSSHGAALSEPVVGAEFHISERFNADDEPNFLLYFFEHEPVYDVTLRVCEQAADRLRLHIIGRCDVGWNDNLGSAVQFELHCWADPRAARLPNGAAR